MASRERWNDRHIERALSSLLKICVIIAALVVLAGGMIYLLHHGGETPDYRTFRGEPCDLCNIPSILMDAFSFRGRGIIQFGLLLLIITPMIWIMFLCLAFIRQRDQLYVVVTLVVLGVLIYSLAGGIFKQPFAPSNTAVPDCRRPSDVLKHQPE